MRAVALVLALAVFASAKDKRPASDYTEGTLQSYRTDEYTVLVGGQKYILTPDHTREFRSKSSVLYLQSSGTKLLFRLDTKKQRAYVLIGDRESKYYVVGIAQ